MRTISSAIQYLFQLGESDAPGCNVYTIASQQLAEIALHSPRDFDTSIAKLRERFRTAELLYLAEGKQAEAYACSRVVVELGDVL